MKHSTTTLIDFAFWGGLVLLTAFCVALSTGLIVGCSGDAPTVEFVKATAQVTQTPTETEITISSDVLIASRFPADFGAALLLVDGSPYCWAIHAAGVRYSPPEVLNRGACLEWLAKLDAPAAYSTTGAFDWVGLAVAVGEVVGGVLGRFVGL